MSYYLFDHTNEAVWPDDLPMGGSLGSQLLSNVWAELCEHFPPDHLAYLPSDFEAQMSQATHIIGHFGQEQRATLAQTEPAIVSDQIILCVTTHVWGAAFDNGEPRKVPSRGGTRYVLFDKSHVALSAGQLLAFLRMTTEEAQAVLDYRGDRLNFWLRSIFFPTLPTLLPALSVLCQGYLAVHAADVGGALQGKATTQEVDSAFAKNEFFNTQQPIAAALDRMQWNKLKERNALPILRDELSAQVKQVRNLQWWRKPFGALDGSGDFDGQTWTEVQNRLELEWNAAKGEPVSGDVRGLLQGIGDGNSAGVTPELVAKAYLQIAERLGDGK
jgi:hypothetical protein